MGRRFLKIPIEHYDMLRYAAMNMADVSTEQLQLAEGEIDIQLCDDDRENWIDIVMNLDNDYKAAISGK